jgi:hypothetical protein
LDNLLSAVIIPAKAAMDGRAALASFLVVGFVIEEE